MTGEEQRVFHSGLVQGTVFIGDSQKLAVCIFSLCGKSLDTFGFFQEKSLEVFKKR